MSEGYELLDSDGLADWRKRPNVTVMTDIPGQEDYTDNSNVSFDEEEKTVVVEMDEGPSDTGWSTKQAPPREAVENLYKHYMWVFNNYPEQRMMLASLWKQRNPQAYGHLTLEQMYERMPEITRESCKAIAEQSDAKRDFYANKFSGAVLL